MKDILRSLLYTFLTILLCRAVPTYAQSIAANFDRQRLAYPQEKLYVHTDRTVYGAGERIWLRVYVVDATSLVPVDSDKYVYVELMDETGFVLRRIKILNTEGLCAGYIDVPQNLSSARYFIRCYTLYSAAVRGYECLQPFCIGKEFTPWQTDGQTYTPPSGLLRCEDEGTAFKVWVDEPAATTYNLAVISRGYMAYEGKITAGYPVVFNKKDMVMGVSQLVAYTDAKDIVGRRLVFSPYGNEFAEAAVGRDSTMVDTPDSLTFVISVPHDVTASLSVSVSKSLYSPIDKLMTIMPQILLGQDIRGGVFDADRFFRSGYRSKAIDSLLCHAVSDRYCIDSVLSGIYTRPHERHETTQTVSGEALITAPYRGKASHATVSIISPKANMFVTATADRNGRFVIPGLDYPDSTDYVVNAVSSILHEKTDVKMDEPTYPQMSYSALAVQKGRGYTPAEDDAPLVGGGGIVLDDIVVKGSKPDYNQGTFSSQADYSITADEIESLDAVCIHEVLRRIPGIYLKGDTAYIRGRISVHGNRHAAIAVDGVILDYNYDLDNIQLQDVARVDVFKSGSAVIWGAKGGPGVISITTKNGSDAHDGVILNRVSKFTPLGYQMPAMTFVASGDAKTVYWNGDVKMKDGKARITLPRECISEGIAYTIQAEGVTDEGMLVQCARKLDF